MLKRLIELEKLEFKYECALIVFLWTVYVYFHFLNKSKVML